ncbi:30S ribosomal protein S13 [Candidatus Woesearchaeota archaeon]|jgi:small subunit ribosomal protein S13|nr:30S ribosomal protein S13 [Candidatus Woesearchaeota archaeon]|tara:strand:- start:1042 stop:1494 length:453 start_codon:yes stop_codon:yes gene_type:complete
MVEFKYLLRVANTDLDGNKKILYALRKIKGVSVMMAHAVCELSGIDENRKTGNLSSKDAEKLTLILNEVAKSGMPEWLLNRRKNPETGKNNHLIGPDLKFAKENDVKMMKKIKSYRGLRHQWSLPVRGQRTKSNFRRNKGKGSLGVKRKG